MSKSCMNCKKWKHGGHGPCPVTTNNIDRNNFHCSLHELKIANHFKWNKDECCEVCVHNEIDSDMRPCIECKHNYCDGEL